RIGQRIEIDDADAVAHGVQHEIATNETGAAGYEPSRHAVLLSHFISERDVVVREVLGELGLGGGGHFTALRRAALRALAASTATARTALATASEHLHLVGHDVGG